MIIEIFGPPGVGKTTLARALTARLRERGVRVELAASYRPAEDAHVTAAEAFAGRRVLDAARRLARPAREMLASARDGSGDSREAVTAKILLRWLPPRSMLWSIRLRQYIRRFSRVWYNACNGDGIVVFDQAFVQLVCSLVLLGPAADDDLIAQALDFVPKPDFLIRLDAPRDVLRARLIERQRRQSRIEHLLEFDLSTNLRSIDVIERLHALLAERGWFATRVGCAERHSLSEAVDGLEREVMARLPAPARAA